MTRVLLVEDSRFLAKAIRELLGEAGYEVDVAANGLDALEALGRQEYDVVLTDMVMPKLDGLGLVQAVRRDWPGLPVILTTAYGSEEVVATALRAGAASYVPKQVIKTDLVSTVANVLAVAGRDAAHKQLLGCLELVELVFSLENDPTLLAPLIGEVQRAVAQVGLCDRTGLVRLGVALREALINAMEHGNLEVDSELRQMDELIYKRVLEKRRASSPYRDRRVYFRASVRRTEAVFTIRDEGPGFDLTTVPDPTEPANFERIGGRGLLLLRAFLDEVRHNDLGNEVILIKRARVDAGPHRRMTATRDVMASLA